MSSLAFDSRTGMFSLSQVNVHSCLFVVKDEIEDFENFAPQIPERILKGDHSETTGNPRLPEMNYPNKIQSHPSLAADEPVFDVPVPNYNTQRPRVQNKKTWWRWDFVRRWRKVIGGGGVKSESKPTTGGTGGGGATGTRGSR